MRNMMLQERNCNNMRTKFFLLSIACLCGLVTAQATPADFGINLQWELRNDSLFITSPAPDEEASMGTFPEGKAPWADDSLSIKAIELPDNLTTIAVSAFESCKALQEVTIPASVTNIYSWAFRNCANLKQVTCLPDTPPTIGTDIFAYCADNLVICVPSIGIYKDTGWGTYESQLSLCSEPTAIDNTHVDAAATKIIESNQLIIIRNNEKYDVTGKKL